MSEQTDSTGTDWTQSEIDLVVSDYFDMRARYFRNEHFVKARHYEEIARLTGRTSGSVQRKYMNISAALERVSLPWLSGFAPNRNLQAALREAVEKYVAQEWNADFIPNPATNAMAEQGRIFIGESPTVLEPLITRSQELERIARKFDPAQRDDRNRKLGAAGEERVFQSEILGLQEVGRPDLAGKVRWVSKEDGDGAGYDILSFDQSGRERFLEVKTTVGHNRTPFFLSRNEKEFAKEASERFRIFRLYEWGKEPKAFLIKPPLENSLILEPTAYRASFG